MWKPRGADESAPYCVAVDWDKRTVGDDGPYMTTIGHYVGATVLDGPQECGFTQTDASRPTPHPTRLCRALRRGWFVSVGNNLRVVPFRGRQDGGSRAPALRKHRRRGDNRPSSVIAYGNATFPRGGRLGSAHSLCAVLLKLAATNHTRHGEAVPPSP